MHLTSQIFACNHGKLSESLCSRNGGTAFEWHVYCILMWNVICWKYGKRDLQQHKSCPDPAVCASAGARCLKQPEKKCRTPQSSELQKQQTKQKIQAFNACMTLSGHLTLHWMESIFSTKEDMSRKAIQKVASARALGLALATELDNSEPQLQMYHFLTNNHVTLLMSPKETPSQLWLKGDSTNSYIFNIHLIPLTIKL